MSSGVAGGLRVVNDSSPAGRESSWWNWSVWVEGPSKALDEVESVTYTLHPTFNNPVHTVRTRSDSFRLRASGWGEFMIEVEVRMKDGAVHTMEHWLTLGRGRSEEDEAGDAPAEESSDGADEAAFEEETVEVGKGQASESSMGPTTSKNAPKGKAGSKKPRGKKAASDPKKGKPAKASFLDRSLMAAAKGRLDVRKMFNKTGIARSLPGLNRVKVFLSSPILYNDLAREIERGLASRWVEFVTAERSVPRGAPVSWWIRKLIASSDGVVAIQGGYQDASIIFESMLAATGRLHAPSAISGRT
ncbi:MAG TPA: hypothetical protein PKU91_07055, partial [Phycisphaerales bacterium]|nr:hypothetical protein [Phycisphaerales bacterium]